MTLKNKLCKTEVLLKSYKKFKHVFYFELKRLLQMFLIKINQTSSLGDGTTWFLFVIAQRSSWVNFSENLIYKYLRMFIEIILEEERIKDQADLWNYPSTKKLVTGIEADNPGSGYPGTHLSKSRTRFFLRLCLFYEFCIYILKFTYVFYFSIFKTFILFVKT